MKVRRSPVPGRGSPQAHLARQVGPSLRSTGNSATGTWRGCCSWGTPWDSLASSAPATATSRSVHCPWRSPRSRPGAGRRGRAVPAPPGCCAGPPERRWTSRRGRARKACAASGAPSPGSHAGWCAPVGAARSCAPAGPRRPPAGSSPGPGRGRGSRGSLAAAGAAAPPGPCRWRAAWRWRGPQSPRGQRAHSGRAARRRRGARLGGRRADCTGAQGEAGATAERLDCQHHRGLSGRWSGVWVPGIPGGTDRLSPPPRGGAVTCAPGGPLRSSLGGEGASEAPWQLGHRSAWVWRSGVKSGLLSVVTEGLYPSEPQFPYQNSDNKTDLADDDKTEGDSAGVELWLFIATTSRVLHRDDLLLVSIKCLINARQSYYLLVVGTRCHCQIRIPSISLSWSQELSAWSLFVSQICVACLTPAQLPGGLLWQGFQGGTKAPVIVISSSSQLPGRQWGQDVLAPPAQLAQIWREVAPHCHLKSNWRYFDLF